MSQIQGLTRPPNKCLKPFWNHLETLESSTWRASIHPSMHHFQASRKWFLHLESMIFNFQPMKQAFHMFHWLEVQNSLILSAKTSFSIWLIGKLYRRGKERKGRERRGKERKVRRREKEGKRKGKKEERWREGKKRKGEERRGVES